MELYTAYIRVTSSLTVDSTLFRIQYMLDLVVHDFPYSNANPKSYCVCEILHLGWLKHVESLQIVGCLPPIRWCPPVISWFIVPLTIDISTINPSY